MATIEQNPQPLLSIVTATYNNAPQLPRFFESILHQVYRQWELIIVNDGSTDETLAICEAYAQQDERIKVLTQDNQGQGVARNWALEHVRGEYIAFVDGDDAIKPETYSAAIEALRQHPECDMVAFPIEWINRDECFVTLPTEACFYGRDSLLTGLLHTGQVRFLLTDKVYAAHLLSGLRFEPRVYFDDNLMMCQIATRAMGLCYVLKGAYEYHQEDFHERKNDWTEHKEYSQIFVNTKMVEALQALYPTLPTQRMMSYIRVCRQVITCLRDSGRKHPTVAYAKSCIRSMFWRDILLSRASLVDKVKVMLLKLWVRLA